MLRKKEKLEVPVGARLSAAKFRALETWCDASFRKRSEVISIVLNRVLEILEQEPAIDQPVEHFVRRLQLGPPASLYPLREETRRVDSTRCRNESQDDECLRENGL